jgi:hypothetical protein
MKASQPSTPDASTPSRTFTRRWLCSRQSAQRQPDSAKPIIAISTGGALRKESDPRFRNFLNEEFAKIYQSGQSKQFYEDALKLRGVDISKVPSVIKEEWK